MLLPSPTLFRPLSLPLPLSPPSSLCHVQTDSSVHLLCSPFSFREYLRYRTTSFVTCCGTGPIITLRPFVLTLITTHDPRTASATLRSHTRTHWFGVLRGRLVNPPHQLFLSPCIFVAQVFNQAHDNFPAADKAAIRPFR